MAEVTGRRYDGTDPELPDGWVHEDGTPCPEYLAADNGTRWWCTEHQQHLRRPAPDPVAAYLAGARRDIEDDRRQSRTAGYEPSPVNKIAVCSVGALEAVLALADEWHKKAMALSAQMTAENVDGAKAGFMMCTLQAYETCAKATRAAISAELLGSTDGQ